MVTISLILHRFQGIAKIPSSWFTIPDCDPLCGITY